jgi:hypothetical protein
MVERLFDRSALDKRGLDEVTSSIRALGPTAPGMANNPLPLARLLGWSEAERTAS